MMLTQLSAKTPSESKTVTFDFTSVLVGSLSSPVITKSTFTGADPLATSLTVGAPGISAGLVTALVSAGTNNCSYELLCTVSDSGGRVYQLGAGITTTTDAA